MNESGLKRMKQDLEVIHQALRFEPIFGWEDVWATLAMASVGAALAIWGGLGLMIPAYPKAARLVTLTIVLILFSKIAVRHHRNIASHPARWREVRITLIAIVTTLPLLFFFLIWSNRHGLSYQSLASTIMFNAGLPCLVIAICDRNRFHYLGVAIPAMFLGLVISLYGFNQRHDDLFLGLFITSCSLFTAGIMAWQLRGKRND